MSLCVVCLCVRLSVRHIRGFCQRVLLSKTTKRALNGNTIDHYFRVFVVPKRQENCRNMIPSFEWELGSRILENLGNVVG